MYLPLNFVTDLLSKLSSRSAVVYLHLLQQIDDFATVQISAKELGAQLGISFQAAHQILLRLRRSGLLLKTSAHGNIHRRSATYRFTYLPPIGPPLPTNVPVCAQGTEMTQVALPPSLPAFPAPSAINALPEVCFP